MKLLKRIFFILVILFLLVQFIPKPGKNLSTETSSADIRLLHAISPEVETILKSSCFDCHSNNTNYPWYSKIQPVAWFLGRHIDEGKKELNFSEFANYSLRRQFHKMEEVEETVKDREMPLKSYALIHRSSKLTQSQQEILIKWSVAIRDSMQLIYPADSLMRKKKAN